MKHTYNQGILGRCFGRFGMVALLAGGAAAAQAQSLAYTTFGTSSVAGTYADLGTTGNAIATANTDDANSVAQDIGFAFSYNGVRFTQFVFNTNGVIRLGSAAPSTEALYYDNNQDATSTDPLQSTSPADVNLLMPFNIDLVAGSGSGGADYRVLTSGAAPNRVCTIQWRNVADKAGAGSDVANVTQYANISFQIKLYETSNTIEFVYDRAVAGGGAAGTRFPNVGLKGSGLAAGQLLLALKPAATGWNATTFQITNYGNVAHNITREATPDAGRTYRFAIVAAPAKDLAVQAIYTLGKIATPQALPQTVRVYLANLGTAAQASVAVTLTVTGANTFTDTKTVALPVGTKGTVTFAPLPASLNLGTNTITVTVPDDENPANNSASVSQLVTTNQLSYIDPTKETDGAFSNSSTKAGGVLSAKYAVPGTAILSEAVIPFANLNAKPTTSYQVVVHDATGSNGTPGNLLYASAAQNRPASGGEVTVPLPSLQVTGAFFIGVKELSPGGVGILTQTETPLRAGTFYYSTNGSAPWNDLAGTTIALRYGIEVGLAPPPNCAAPTALAITSPAATTAIVSFAGASAAGSYEVIYGPTGFQPATGGTTVTATTSPFTLTGLQPGTNYQVYVRANCTGGGKSLLAGPVAFSTACAAGAAVTAFPYTEGFDSILAGQALPCGITVLDANNDQATWTVSKASPSSGTSSLRYNGLVLKDVAADDWFFTPALTLAATSRYQLSFRYRGEGIANSPSAYTESLEVRSGTAPTGAEQTNLLYTNAAITNTSYELANNTSTPAVALLPAGASTQYIGFHIKSAANQGNLYIDDIIVAAAAVTATSEALLRAVSIFPNPSTTGVFDLDVHGANARGSLSVLVTNALGQRVYEGSARDNYTNKLDLSNLAAGIYHLQVRHGGEQLSRQLSIVK